MGVVIALGAMLAQIWRTSAPLPERLANAILQRTSPRMIPWTMTLVAFIIGIPMFFEVGLVVMLPLIFSVALAWKARSASGARPMCTWACR